MTTKFSRFGVRVTGVEYSFACDPLTGNAAGVRWLAQGKEILRQAQVSQGNGTFKGEGMSGATKEVGAPDGHAGQDCNSSKEKVHAPDNDLKPGF
jgi:hypothetical protein